MSKPLLSSHFLVYIFVLSSAFPSAVLAQNSNWLKPIPNYQPIQANERVKWYLNSTAGVSSLLLAGPISSGWGTLLNRPEEYGPHWEGFGKRYGMRLTGVATGNAIEVTMGAALGEDPRYFRSTDQVFGARVKHVLKSTFMAPNRKGEWRPAYARFAGNVGNNFLSNTWRVQSESTAEAALLRCVWGITGRMASHAFNEFLPDAKKLIGR
jgi:hypothetical protein